MSSGETTRQDERSQQLARLRKLLHLAGVVPLLAGVIVYYFAYLAPLSAKERELSERISKISNLLKHTDDIRTKLSETAIRLEQQRQRAAEVRQRIPDRPDVDEFLRSLSEAAGASDLSIHDFSRGATTHNATFSQVDISLECEGTYASVCRFLDRLEQIPRVARVTSMEITSESSRERYPLLMDIRLYFGMRSATGSKFKTTMLSPYDRARRWVFVAVDPYSRQTVLWGRGGRYG